MIFKIITFFNCNELGNKTVALVFPLERSV